ILMITQNVDKKRDQIQMFCIDDLVPNDHLLRLIDKAINKFINKVPVNCLINQSKQVIIWN
ncbi:MAG: hypothetical protein J6L69_07330, partial [Lachnospiraceae bacterium]|nr:hypothetical protein [Lachnospiraceae bacterium]